VKTFDFERNQISKNEGALHNEYIAANITFENQVHFSEGNSNQENKNNLSFKEEKNFDFLKKLNEDKIAKKASNKNLCNIPLPNKTNYNNININDRNMAADGKSKFSNKQIQNELFVDGNIRSNLALTPQIKLNKNVRDASNDN
jgi:hypothetical protein